MTKDERNALRAIEQGLRATDPAFVARMSEPAVAGPPFPAVSALCALTVVCVPIEALLFGGPAAVFTLCLVVTVVTVILLRRGRS